MTNKDMERCLTSQAIRNMQTKTKKVYPYTNTRMAKVKIATMPNAYKDAEITVDVWVNGKSLAAWIL